MVSEGGSEQGDGGYGIGRDDGGDAVDDGAPAAGDTFGVGVQVTDEELRFVVHVPSDIDSGWTDPESFQALVQRVVWDHLNREETLRTIARTAEVGETVTLGTVTLQPDESVVSHSLSAPLPLRE